jgi:hypothetical protein
VSTGGRTERNKLCGQAMCAARKIVQKMAGAFFI